MNTTQSPRADDAQSAMVYHNSNLHPMTFKALRYRLGEFYSLIIQEQKAGRKIPDLQKYAEDFLATRQMYPQGKPLEF